MKKQLLVFVSTLLCLSSFVLRAEEFTGGPLKIFSAPQVEKAESHVVPVAEVGLPFYKNIKQYYNYKDYRPGFNDRYDPVGATVASALVPGLGQSLCGEPYRGIYFVAGSTLCFGLSAACFGISVDNYDQNGNRKGNVGLDLLGTVSLLGGIAIWVWNAIDANHVAKTKNLYLRDIMDKTGVREFRLSPSVGYIPNGSASAGLTLGITF